ncbi:MAG: acetyltransferase [Pseudohongiella sp.]|nr:MAG: acetyltransferase [Pseudohongiella sp.]
MGISIRPASEADFDAIVELNDAEVQQTSPMNLQRLALLNSISDYHRVAVVDDRIAGFLLTMRESASYTNDNFSWFAGRYSRFIYIDRIVVADYSSGKGIGRALYEDLMQFARSNETYILACEYNIEPPNLPSKKFHDRMGFKQVGTQRVAMDTKLVSLQVAQLD